MGWRIPTKRRRLTLQPVPVSGRRCIRQSCPVRARACGLSGAAGICENDLSSRRLESTWKIAGIIMNRHGARLVLVMWCVLLTCATPATAGCASVLWLENILYGSMPSTTEWILVGAYRSEDACAEQLAGKVKTNLRPSDGHAEAKSVA